MNKLSIVIPAYNEAKTIQEVLQKVLDVELPEGFQKEILLINDSSTDQTEGVVQGFTRNPVRVAR